MTRLAIQYEGEPQITEIFEKTGDEFNVFSLIRNDGVLKSLMFKHLLDNARRRTFTDHDKVGIIAYAPSTGTPVYGDLSQATFVSTGSTKFVIPVLSETPPPQEYPTLTAAKWRTFISRLATAQKNALRAAIQAALAIDPADPADNTAELAYLAEMNKREAAERLISLSIVHGYDRTLSDLGTIGITITGTALTNFNSRWLAVSAL